ncbi:MAG: transporter substrate-binding domain-containing protein [Oscillibacter sp.]|jgi:polar amino acid transport system substrate-binding protein|nr:transporter substrate-binding domain-containing protein [Oscillibacter sp.]
MKKIAALFLTGLLLLSCTACGGGKSGASASAGTSDRLDQIKERGCLEVATEPYFAPYEFIDASKTGDEQYQGCDILLAQYIADKIGVKLKIVPLEFSSVLAGVTEGKYDLAISAIAYSPAREEAMALSDGYIFTDTGYGFLVRSGDEGKYTTAESAKEAVIVTQSGSVQEALYHDAIGSCKEFKLVSSMTDGYLAVAEGKADLCVCSLSSAKLYADANGGLAVSSFQFDVDPDMNSVRVGAPTEGTDSLMKIVNGCIKELTDDQQIQTWYDEAADYAATLGIK